jgi:hypothetical protein
MESGSCIFGRLRDRRSLRLNSGSRSKLFFQHHRYGFLCRPDIEVGKASADCFSGQDGISIVACAVKRSVSQ